MAGLAATDITTATVPGSFVAISPWALIGLLTLPIAVCLGLLVLAAHIGRSTAEDAVVEQTNCSACDARNPADRRSCRYCGSALAGE
ncbi:hypothetical protein [Halosimplex sp. J119]